MIQVPQLIVQHVAVKYVHLRIELFDIVCASYRLFKFSFDSDFLVFSIVIFSFVSFRTVPY